MDNFLETHNHPKLNWEEINHLNRPKIHNEIEATIESPKKEKYRTWWILHETFDDLIPNSLNFSTK
jgi:hypothetical protein